MYNWQNEAAAILPLDEESMAAARARLLAALPADRLPEQVRGQLAKDIQEYIGVQEFNAERPEAQVNLGTLYADLGRNEEAEAAYRKAIERQPNYIPAYVNVAHLLSALRREQEADGVLRRGLERNPKSSDLEHALGLSLVRQKRVDEATAALARAAKLAPDNARYGYVYAVALQSGGKLDEAIWVLDDVHQRHPGDIDTLVALVTFNRDGGHPTAALKFARELQELMPNNPTVDQLVGELDRLQRR